MTSALVRVFGFANLPLVEDVVHDALVAALEVWKFRGVPENPAAWLMTAARNRAIDALRRERKRDAGVDSEEAADAALPSTLDAAFGEEALIDEQLRMMF